MHNVNRFKLPVFVVAVVHDPVGYKPGRYYYAMKLDDGTKVSRYLRRPSQAQRKIAKYTDLWNNGDRFWPEVDRADELRDSKDAIPTRVERFWDYMVETFGIYPVWP